MQISQLSVEVLCRSESQFDTLWVLKIAFTNFVSRAYTYQLQNDNNNNNDDDDDGLMGVYLARLGWHTAKGEKIEF